MPAPPPSLAPTFLQLDIAGALAPAHDRRSSLVFFFLALFDSIGTLVGVGEQAGLMRDGTLPRARQALLADAVGTVAGAALGHVDRDGVHRERRGRRGRRPDGL